MATKRLTKAKLKQLAGVLAGTPLNVYREHERLFGTSCTEAIFDRLRDEEKLQRCELCSVWQESCDIEPGWDCTCCECVNDEQ